MASKREALNHCGRLKKGFKFRKGGGIVKAGKGGGTSKKKRTARRRAAQGALF